MAADEAEMRRALSAADASAEGVRAAAKRVLSAPDSAESSAKVWLDCLQAAEPPRKLALIYVANEIVQRGRKAHGNLFSHAFAPLFKRAAEDLAKYARRAAPPRGLALTLASRTSDASACSKASRVFSVLRDRKILGANSVEQLTKVLSQTAAGPAPKRAPRKRPRIAEPKTPPGTPPPHAYQTRAAADEVMQTTVQLLPAPPADKRYMAPAVAPSEVVAEVAAEPLAKRIASLQQGSVSLGMLTQQADAAMDAAIRAAEGVSSARGVPGEARVEVPVADTRQRVASLQEMLAEATEQRSAMIRELEELAARWEAECAVSEQDRASHELHELLCALRAASRALTERKEEERRAREAERRRRAALEAEEARRRKQKEEENQKAERERRAREAERKQEQEQEQRQRELQKQQQQQQQLSVQPQPQQQPPATGDAGAGGVSASDVEALLASMRAEAEQGSGAPPPSTAGYTVLRGQGPVASGVPYGRESYAGPGGYPQHATPRGPPVPAYGRGPPRPPPTTGALPPGGAAYMPLGQAQPVAAGYGEKVYRPIASSPGRGPPVPPRPTPAAAPGYPAAPLPPHGGGGPGDAYVPLPSWRTGGHRR